MLEKAGTQPGNWASGVPLARRRNYNQEMGFHASSHAKGWIRRRMEGRIRPVLDDSAAGRVLGEGGKVSPECKFALLGEFPHRQ